uniref:TetR family transcriptional regulator n=2 Tax=Pseudomonadota TaxID=1224 RepID=UPI0013D23798
PEAARLEALAAARALLLEGGPNAVTLKAVGEAIGMSHANVIHHFGSAAGLQSALMGAMVRDLADALTEAVDHVRSDDAAFRRLVD